MKRRLPFLMLLATTMHYAQVSLVQDINPTGDSNPSDFTELNGVLYFKASDLNSVNFELWRTDGTNAGTYLVKDLNTSASSNPTGLFAFNNKIYFKAGGSLYSSDGSDAGTVLFKSSAFIYEPYFTELNNELYYARHFASGQRGLFKFDGTSETQLSTGGEVRYLSKYGSANKIIFQSDGTNSQDWEIWQSDGTPSGTNELADLNGGDLIGSDAKQFFEANGKVFFTAFGANNVGRELFITDGTTSGTVLIKNINPTNSGGNAANSNPNNFTLFNNKLYFTANDATNGDELWVSDGTTAGTYMVLDLYTGATGSNPSNLFVFNNALYFSADHPTLGREVFKCTISNNVTNLKNISIGSGSSNPSNFIEYNGKLYFVAEDPVNGRELWSSTGFNSTTNLVADINSGSANSNPDNLAVMGNNLYFSADDGVSGIGNELYKYIDPVLTISKNELISIDIYPNPTKNVFTIKNDSIKGIEIYDVNGKKMKSIEASSVYNIEDLKTGIYFIKVFNDNGIKIGRIVKD